eukprot:5898992-Pyramimonas_sp.AAC.1
MRPSVSEASRTKSPLRPPPRPPAPRPRSSRPRSPPSGAGAGSAGAGQELSPVAGEDPDLQARLEVG